MTQSEEFKRAPFVYMMFFLSCGMLMLVNLLEGSYARTLISCDTPVSTEPGTLFSGSAACGDRGYVITEGQRLSSTAQSCEMIAKLTVMVIAAVFSDLYGRKFTLLIGLSCTAISVFLLLIGSLFPTITRLCFYMGQGLQGAFPSELIVAQITGDLAMREDTDTQLVNACSGVSCFLSQAVFGIVVFVVQSMEITDYTGVWFITLLINGGSLASAVFMFEETRVNKAEDTAAKSLGEQVLGEFSDYAALFRLEGLWAVMITYVLKAISDNFFSLKDSLPMAYYQISIDKVLLCWFFLILLVPLCSGLVPGMSAKMGERKTFWCCNYMLFSANLVFLGAPLSGWFYFGTYALFMIVNPGYEGLTTSMSTKFLAEKYAKYTALRQLSGYSLSIVTGPLYAYLFNARATSYLALGAPIFFSLFFRALEAVFWFHPDIGSFRYMDKSLDALTEERLKVSAEAAKPAEEKKSD